MPTFTNPKFVYVEPRGFPVLAVAVFGVEAFGGYELAQWLASIAVVILVCAGVAAISSVAVLAAVMHRRRGLQHIDAPRWVVERCGAPRLPSHGAIPARLAAAVPASQRPALEAPAVHYHLHLHAAPIQLPQPDDN